MVEYMTMIDFMAACEGPPPDPLYNPPLAEQISTVEGPMNTAFGPDVILVKTDWLGQVIPERLPVALAVAALSSGEMGDTIKSAHIYPLGDVDLRQWEDAYSWEPAPPPRRKAGFCFN